MLYEYHRFLMLFLWLCLHGTDFFTNERIGIRLAWQVAKIVWLE